jgi:hypothetical protein
MRITTKILAGLLVVAAGGWLAGCNSTIDKEPNVVLEVENVTIPPVTSTQDSVLNTCTYTITPATATFKNKPKNQFAGSSPFNDILLKSVDVSYIWDDGAPMQPVRAGVGGSVPANGSATGNFSVVASHALATTCLDGSGNPVAECRGGHTASLGLTFNGVTVSGDDVSVSTGGTLQVNSCTVQFTGACCTGTNVCSLLTNVNCQNAGGVYAGDNTSCLTTNCP